MKLLKTFDTGRFSSIVKKLNLENAKLRTQQKEIDLEIYNFWQHYQKLLFGEHTEKQPKSSSTCS